MSFQDLESGRAFTSQGSPMYIDQSPSRTLAAAVFRISTAVSAYKRLVTYIGTPKDTVNLRHKLRETGLQIRQLVKETSAELNHVRDTNKFAQVNATKKIAEAKLTKDYEAVLKDFQKAQLLAAEKEKSFAPRIGDSTHYPSSRVGELEISSLNPRQASLLAESNRQLMHMENEITLNEAIVEEREQGIREIQTQIGELNEIFRDMALLVSQQGALIGDISSNTEGARSATAQAASHLAKASKTQRSTSSMTCLMLVIAGIVLLIIVFLVAA